MQRNKLFLMTGKSGSGKSMVLKQLLDELDSSGIRTGGILAPGRYLDSGEKVYGLELVPRGKDYLLSTRSEKKNWQAIGGFYFNPQAVEAGLRHLAALTRNDYHLYLLDEIGPFELNDLLWAPAIPGLLNKGKPMIWTLRPGIREQVKSKWDLKGPDGINLDDTGRIQAIEKTKIWLKTNLPGLS